MASTIERVRDNLDPQTTANAIYEIMMLWHACDQKITASPKGQRPIHQGRRQAFELCLAQFFNIPPLEVRALLRNHYHGKRSHGRNSGAFASVVNDG